VDTSGQQSPRPDSAERELGPAGSNLSNVLRDARRGSAPGPAAGAAALPDTAAPSNGTECGSDVVFDNGALRITRACSPSTLVIAGDIDEYTHAGLIAALTAATAGPGEVHISLAGVQYCDVAGLRTIVAMADTDDAAQHLTDRRVVLHDLPEPLHAVLRILGWDSIPGLVVAGRDDRMPPATGAPASGACSCHG
jgi:ABC-type transporter Mla MlaB component